MLRLMRQVDDPVGRHDVRLRASSRAGESVGKDLHEWGIGALQAPINELFGQTECNLVLGSNARYHAGEFGSIGRAIPATSRPSLTTRAPLPAGDLGNIAIRSPDPVMMLEYGITRKRRGQIANGG